MRRSVKQVFQTLIGAAAVASLLLSPALAAEKKDFKVAWSIYVGWMPWGYAAESGIVKKWADKYGINIEVKQFNDYVESINQYTAGAFDAVTSPTWMRCRFPPPAASTQRPSSSATSRTATTP